MSNEIGVCDTTFREQLGTILKGELIRISYINGLPSFTGYLIFVGKDFLAVGKNETYDTLIPLARIALVETIKQSELE